jgi:hypothetical protein
MTFSAPLLTGLTVLFAVGIIFTLTAIIGAVLRIASRNILVGFFIAGIVMIVQAVGCNVSFQIGQMSAIMQQNSGGPF